MVPRRGEGGGYSDFSEQLKGVVQQKSKHYWRGNLKQSKLKTTIKLKFMEICTRSNKDNNFNSEDNYYRIQEW